MTQALKYVELVYNEPDDALKSIREMAGDSIPVALISLGCSSVGFTLDGTRYRAYTSRAVHENKTLRDACREIEALKGAMVSEITELSHN